jgi:fructokinase
MFLVCGEALFDVFVGADDGHGALALKAVVGGSPFNVAVGLARLAQPVALLAGVSTDVLGDKLARHLAEEGVARDYLVRRPEPTTLSLVGLGADGSPRYTFYGHRAADVSVTPDDLPVLGPQVRGLHFGSYALVAPPAADAYAALAARAGERLVTFDPNVRLTVEPDREVWRARIAAMLPFATVVKVSEEDLVSLWPGADHEALAQGWLEQGPALVVVTRGARGVVAFTRRGAVSAPGRTVDVVDTVGAGDSFQAALIAGLLERGVADHAGVAALPDDALAAILTRCCAAAAIVCGRRGADLPRLAEL